MKQLPNLARSQNTYAGYSVSRLLTLGTPIQSRIPDMGLIAFKLGSFPKHVLRKSSELVVALKYAHSVTYTRYRLKMMKDNDKLEEMRYYMEETLIPAYMKPRCYSIPILLMSQFCLMFGVARHPTPLLAGRLIFQHSQNASRRHPKRDAKNPTISSK
uniref:Uncharacterized protein n=1 Tax=Timema cristinae TaxID=61476 RepID=A0A7R9DAT6_TIMCR|nr:unnamed protein product [Timema cristinae]